MLHMLCALKHTDFKLKNALSVQSGVKTPKPIRKITR